jgi:hypothetical protein
LLHCFLLYKISPEGVGHILFIRIRRRKAFLELYPVFTAFEEGVMFDTERRQWRRPYLTFVVWTQHWNQTSFSCPYFFFFCLSGRKPRNISLHCQEMTLNIVLGGQEDCFLMNATGVCCVLLTTLQREEEFGSAKPRAADSL